MEPAAWLWIPITIAAAFAQTLRNAGQRLLVPDLGTLGATLVRFLYGLPFATAWLIGVLAVTHTGLPAPNARFALFVTGGAICQMLATALLLRAMMERNFTLGIAYSKSEIIQVALIGFVLLGDPVSAVLAVAIGCATLGVLFLSPADPRRPIRAFLTGWTTRPALMGIAAGTGFALAGVGYRGASLSLTDTSFVVAAASTLVCAQLQQTALLGGWLGIFRPRTAIRVLNVRRLPVFVGLMGAMASVGWFTAMAIESVAHVYTLGLIELLFSYVISRRLFREHLTRLELSGMLLLGLGLVIVALER